MFLCVFLAIAELLTLLGVQPGKSQYDHVQPPE